MKRSDSPWAIAYDAYLLDWHSEMTMLLSPTGTYVAIRARRRNNHVVIRRNHLKGSTP